MRAFHLILLGAVVAAVGAVLGAVNPVLGAVLGVGGALTSIAAAVKQEKESVAYIRDFSTADWYSRPEGDYELAIPRITHQKAHPQTVFMLPDGEGGFEAALTDIVVKQDGAVVVRVAQPMEGRVQIK
ncbi:hypothetical protein [Deinococcus koreensis]|uniref:hypothetical protein n=1 Tax=Deinococcus koreensis TaxID=2054903 RepID=UPI00105715A2|nr:hypothetical protein [Deinococcus koreensis]